MAKPPAPLPPEVLAAFERRQPVEAFRLLFLSLVRTAYAARQQQGGSVTKPKTLRPTPAPKSIESIKPDDGLSPGEVPSTSSVFWTWCVVALLAYLAYRLVRG